MKAAVKTEKIDEKETKSVQIEHKSDKEALSPYIGNMKRPSLEEEMERINKEREKREIEAARIRHLELKTILERLKKTKEVSEESKKEESPMDLEMDIDVNFDHTKVNLQAPLVGKVIPKEPSTALTEKDQARFAKFKSVNLESPKIPMSLHYTIPQPLRQASLQRLITEFEKKFPKNIAVLHALEMEEQVYDKYTTKSGYWARINELVKFEIHKL